MLSEKAIDKLIEPLVNRQEALNNYIVNLIARRIKEIGALLPSDVLKLQQLLKSGGDVRKINKEIARITGLQEKEIKNIIKTVAEDAYVDAKPYYDYRQKSYIPFEENVELQKIIKSIQKQTVDTYVNLAKAQAFMIRDLGNPNVLREGERHERERTGGLCKNRGAEQLFCGGRGAVSFPVGTFAADPHAGRAIAV